MAVNNWQDIVFGVGGFIFAMALIPSILHKANKPAAATSLITAVLLTLYCACFLTLNLLLGFLSGLLSATAWWILFVQKIIMKEK